MARLTFANAGIGDTSECNGVTGAFTVDSTIKRSGGYSFKAPASAASAYGEFAFLPGQTTDHFFARVWIYVPTGGAPDSNTNIAAFQTSAGTVGCALRLNTDLSVTLMERANFSAIGSSSPMTTDAWHCLILELDCSAPGASTFKGYLDSGTAFASTSRDLSPVIATGVSELAVGFMSATTGTAYFSGIAVNDDSGSTENSLPSRTAKIVYLSVDGNGTLLGTQGTDWDTGPSTGGTAWQMVDETPPDDETTYIALITNSSGVSNRALDFTLQSSASAGIGASDTINVVAVGWRLRGETSANLVALLRLKSQSGGTVVEGSTSTFGFASFQTHNRTSGRFPLIVSHTDPQAGGAWTPALLDTAQVGCRATDASPDAWVTKLWLMVEYEPAAAPSSKPWHFFAQQSRRRRIY